MIRLTEQREDGRWCVKGIDWMDIREGTVIKRKVMERLYGCLCKLKDYENSGLDPSEVRENRDDLEVFQQKHRWILAKERLPDANGDYLVTMLIPGYNQGKPVTNWLTWDVDEGIWIDGLHLDPITEEVIAWKAIPEAYGEV